MEWKFINSFIKWGCNCISLHSSIVKVDIVLLKNLFSNKTTVVPIVIGFQLIFGFLVWNNFIFLLTWHVYITYVTALAVCATLYKTQKFLITIIFIFFILLFWNNPYNDIINFSVFTDLILKGTLLYLYNCNVQFCVLLLLF